MKRILGLSMLLVCAMGYGSQQPMLFNKSELIQSMLNDMVFIKGGSFHIGDAKHRKMYPNAIVTLDSYYLDKYATTAKQFKSYQHLIGKAVNKSKSDKMPMYNGMYPALANYHDALNFCHWLGQQTHLPITMVTDAQWEYAARSRGKNVEYATNNGKLEPGKNFPDKKAYSVPDDNNPWYPGKRIWYTWSTKVNAFPSNPLGMYAMTGNGAEWIKGYWTALPIKPVNNPQNNSGKLHALRGTGISAVTTALDPKTPKKERLWHLSHINIYSRIFATTPTMTFHFRCAINTAKQIP